jgi:hypothetical protein
MVVPEINCQVPLMGKRSLSFFVPALQDKMRMAMKAKVAGVFFMY